MLILQNLSVSFESTQILHNLDLIIEPGSVHALMGPNGSGKSTLGYTLMGHPKYQITNGSINFKDNNLLALTVDKRAKLGIFLSFQQPCEIPGLSVFSFLKEAYTAYTGNNMPVAAFKEMLQKYLLLLHLDESYLYRGLHEGFSGGEKKKLEMLQVLLLNPSFVILDEIDSGLDVDALRIVAQALHYCKERNPSMSILLITHYRRILDYITPDHVHILINGTLVQSGNASLAHSIELKGYSETAL